MRPGAKKVLVMITDTSSRLDKNDIKRAAKPLDDREIQVIPVSVGDEVDPKELQQTTTDIDNYIHAPVDGDPKNLAVKIMEKIFRGG